MGDFADHMTTVFTDVRLKRFLEMRGADAGSAEMMVAQSALWVGLLYDDAALAAAEALVRGLGRADALALRAAVPRQGMATRFRSGTLRDLARDVVAIARDGLRARGLPGCGRRWTKRSIWRRWRRLPPAVRPRRNIGWRAIMATGMVTRAASSPRRRSRS